MYQDEVPSLRPGKFETTLEDATPKSPISSIFRSIGRLLLGCIEAYVCAYVAKFTYVAPVAAPFEWHNTISFGGRTYKIRSIKKLSFSKSKPLLQL